MTACKINGKAIGWPSKTKDAAGVTSAGSGGSGGSTEPAAADHISSAAPVAGASASAQRPPWCDAPGANIQPHSSVDYLLKEDDPGDAVFELVGHFCADRPNPARWPELEGLRATWSKRLRMNDADWRDAVDWARSRPARSSSPPSVDAKRALSSLDAIEQYVLLAGATQGLEQLADALEPRLTAIGRMAYTRRCLNDDKIETWVTCHPDVLAFDADKIRLELRSAKGHTGYERTQIRLELDQLRDSVAARIAAVDERLAKDPGYRKLFALGAEIRTRWAARSKSDASLALALAMDDARRADSRSGYGACDEKTWSAFSAAVSSLPAKRFAFDAKRPFAGAAAALVLADEDAALAFHAMRICAEGRGQGTVDLLNILSTGMPGPSPRGPRTATQTALLDSDIVLDDRSVRLTYLGSNRRRGDRGGTTPADAQGVVSKIEKNAKGVVISFAAKMEPRQECARVKVSSRVSHIDDDGTVHYHQSCLKWATKMVDVAPRPRTVSARYLAGVQRGAHVEIIRDVVTVVRPAEGALPLAVFGVAVK